MKRCLFITMLFFAVLSVYAQHQRGFVCTGNNVNIRKGPGKSFPVVKCFEEWFAQLYKGQVVVDLGKSKGGFRFISYGLEHNQECSGNGWVSAQYLRPVKICSKCDGSGWAQIEDYLDTCPKCKGKGWLKP